MALPKKTPGSTTQVMTWEKELAEAAIAAAEQESRTSTGGQFFSLQGGQISFGGSNMPGNEIAVIVVGSILENVKYQGIYDPNNPTSPMCFAFGRSEDEMAPHDLALEPQCENCKTCEHNQWVKGQKGKGCRNTRRLALISAGNFVGKAFQMVDDPAHYAEQQLTYMKLPVTSVKNFAGFVKQTAAALQRPPYGVFVRIYTLPDPKNQFTVNFEVLGKVPNHLMQAVRDKHKEAEQLIDFPYQPIEPTVPAPPARAAAKAPAKRKY